MAGGTTGAAAAATAGGFEGGLAETLAVWETDAARWHSVGSPWRPSPGDVSAYRRLAGPRLGGRVVILGVTPELRDAVAEAGGRALVLDVSQAMHAAATPLLEHGDLADETWIQTDWGDARLPPGAFDLVLGDMIWWAVSVSRQHALCDTIRAALAPDGLLVSRFRFTDPTRAGQSAEPVLRDYLRRLERNPDDEQVLRGALYSWLYDHTTDRASKRLDRNRARALVLGLAATPEFSRHQEYLHGFADRLRGPDWTSQTREELLGIVGARFEVTQEAHADDYDSGFYPVVALTPR